MTRRPIFIGVATLLALALTAGLAYGVGRLAGNRMPAGRSAHQRPIGAASLMPSASANHAQVRRGSTGGPALQTWMRAWMRAWMRDGTSRYGWGGRERVAGYGRLGAGHLGPTSDRPSGGFADGFQRIGGWIAPADRGDRCCLDGYERSRYHHRWHDCW